MALWSQSHFLQSLGWATLNSFWQMALLWSLFLAAKSIFRISSEIRYKLATAAIIGGFGWFVLTFLLFYLDSGISGISLFNKSLYQSESLINILLLSASVSYLALLLFPAFRLFRNWRYVQKIKKEGLQKAGLNYRLYVQKIAAQLGIKKKVLLYLSELVTSPITIGYLKPIILLPVAALNNLTIQQAEAILLHELSHIRRYDYLFNFIISIINTILYFNPFVKQFMKVMEEERENCCDQLVLHYGYDKISYASALLTLEKASVSSQVLVLGAAGKKNLLNRIENIIGMEKK
ncbi:MAG TPA: M56 family metallopeptidase, partial [Flavisolibacter sp.]|nr:M56 family metallopeptidase [Flavisolibacter sp.]